MKFLIFSFLLACLVAVLSPWAIAAHHKQPASFSHKLFERFDSDGDGAISTAEHEAAITEMSEQRRQRFAAMDANGDGSVSKDEARAMGKERRDKLKHKMQQKRGDIFDKLDSDGDGMLSREEAKALGKMRRFK